MLSRTFAALLFSAAVAVSTPANALQCVPFARDVSGISIRGDAWTWWSSAVGTYERGHAPRIGAVVVFQKTRSMRHGHVAVVTDVVNSREVLVDHANWGSRRIGGRGKIAKGMSVIDISPRNDWTQVRVWNRSADDYGTRTYPTYGFIYAPGSREAHVQMANYIPEPPRVEIGRAAQSRTAALAAVPTVAAPAPAAHSTTTRQAAAHAGKSTAQAERSLDTVDLQIASVMSQDPSRALRVEPKGAAVAEQKPASADEAGAAPASGAAMTEDQALARRFGSGRY